MAESSSKSSIGSSRGKVLRCKCGQKRALYISGTDKNQDRIFAKCEKCKWWKWLDVIEGYGNEAYGHSSHEEIQKLREEEEIAHTRMNDKIEKLKRRHGKHNVVFGRLVGGFVVMVMVLCMFKQ